MFSKAQAMALVEKAIPGSKAVAGVLYNDLYLIRITYPDPDEQNYDPFFSVNPTTGEVKDFSVLTDGNIEEITKLFLGGASS